jgi:hypothetical protein
MLYALKNYYRFDVFSKTAIMEIPDLTEFFAVTRISEVSLTKFPLFSFVGRVNTAELN